MTVTRIADGLYRVTDGARRWRVAVAGPAHDQWVWCDGAVIHVVMPRETTSSRGRAPAQDLATPMPATVVHVMVEVGQRVARGDTLLMLEAMKMELPIRSPHDGVVRAVRCRPGELVQPGVNLVEVG